MLTLIKAFVPNIVFILWFVFSILTIYYSWSNKKHRYIFISASILFYLMTTRPLNQVMMGPLEQYQLPPIDSLEKLEVKQVVILTGGGYENTLKLSSSKLSPGTRARLLGGLELASRLGDDCTIICTGGMPGLPVGEYLGQIVEVVQPERTVYAEAEAMRTIEHPQRIEEFLTDSTLILVTSAFHMPRSMRVFRDAGYNPIPCPVDYKTKELWEWRDFIPSIDFLYVFQSAYTEYLKTILYWFER